MPNRLTGPDFLDSVADQNDAQGLPVNAAEFRQRATDWRQDQQRIEQLETQVARLERQLRTADDQARLLGLEAPVKHAHTDPTGEEERAVPVAFPVPPQLDPAAWQAFAAKAAKEAQGDG